MASLKQFSTKEVAEHNTNRSAWIIIGNKVYDVTKFLDEHPGGCEVLLEQAGRDGTEEFEDVGHSTDARTLKEDYLIGEIEEGERKTYSYEKKTWKPAPSENKQRNEGSPTDNLVYFALLAVIVGFIYYLFTK
ncbi:unnamed protein product [Caenorhabditis bovis]|uniref:Cytochrome b5 n=1 Tax=Caenorhabditis bovis TaxID=2654633 RepID=A0A8S1EF40_9PELO|nr:unnamed protein product [Caenorhabditis bovis]